MDHTSATYYLQPAYKFAIKNDLSFAAWRLPGNVETGMITGEVFHSEPDDVTQPAFLFSGFEPDRFHFIKPLFLMKNNQVLTDRISNEFDFTVNKDKFHEIHGKHKELEIHGENNEEQYVELVRTAVELLDNKDFIKVVLARKENIILPDDFDLPDFFQRLKDNYPEAFVYLLHSPEAGTWVGASPELLLEASEEKLRTVALAGTKTIDDIKNNMVFGSKEKLEQEIVSMYIRDCFKSMKIPFTESLPLWVQTANVFHIKTEFSAPFNNRIFGLISKLHPTPAVAGYPRDKSIKYILENENFPRKLYSGYLGPYLNKNDFHLYVNLRCMEISDSVGTLYAGAGILKDSVPGEEWQETKIKMETLLNLI